MLALVVLAVCSGAGEGSTALAGTRGHGDVNVRLALTLVRAAQQAQAERQETEPASEATSRDGGRALWAGADGVIGESRDGVIEAGQGVWAGLMNLPPPAVAMLIAA